MFPHRALPFVLEMVEPVSSFHERWTFTHSGIGDAGAVSRRAKADYLTQRLCRRNRWRWIVRSRGEPGLLHVGHETIAHSRHRLDVALTCGLFAHGPAQYRDVVIEVVLLDHAIGPDAAHQLVFGEQASGVLYQHPEGCRTPWLSTGRAGRRTAGGVHAHQVGTGRTHTPGCGRTSFQKNFRKRPRLLKDVVGRPRA